MALVKCPECGRENVSDKAEMCPNCGYNLKEHFDDLKLAQIKEEREKKELDKIQMPSKPNIFFDFGVSFLIFGLLVYPVSSMTLQQRVNMLYSNKKL
jgi:uncharacterized membrane protein YvbJ